MVNGFLKNFVDGINIVFADMTFIRSWMHGDANSASIETDTGSPSDAWDFHVAGVAQVRDLVYIDT